MNEPTHPHRPRTVRAVVLRKNAFYLLNGISIGLRSGEYCGNTSYHTSFDTARCDQTTIIAPCVARGLRPRLPAHGWKLRFDVDQTTSEAPPADPSLPWER